MNERRKGGFKPTEIPDYFRTYTNATRLLLAQAVKKDVAAADLVANHAEAVQVALIELRKFFRRSRPADGSELRKYMREEVDAVWDIQETMETDITLIQRLSARIESELTSITDSWRSTLDGAELAIDGSFDILRAAALDAGDPTKTSPENVAARRKAIDTLENIRQRWSAIAITIATAKNIASSRKTG
jgi:hypothetical protein